jgi:hypothetical protein
MMSPLRKSRIGPPAHSAEDHRKGIQNKKRTRTSTDNQEPIRDKLFAVITNKVITMLKIKGARAPDELAGPNKGKIRLLSRADEKSTTKESAMDQDTGQSELPSCTKWQLRKQGTQKWA